MSLAYSGLKIYSAILQVSAPGPCLKNSNPLPNPQNIPNGGGEEGGGGGGGGLGGQGGTLRGDHTISVATILLLIMTQAYPEL